MQRKKYPFVVSTRLPKPGWKPPEIPKALPLSPTKAYSDLQCFVFDYLRHIMGIHWQEERTFSLPNIETFTVPKRPLRSFLLALSLKN